MDKILWIIHEIENVEDFIKVSYPDGKIDAQTANELLRLLNDIKEFGMKTRG